MINTLWKLNFYKVKEAIRINLSFKKNIWGRGGNRKGGE